MLMISLINLRNLYQFSREQGSNMQPKRESLIYFQGTWVEARIIKNPKTCQVKKTEINSLKLTINR
jgi:hypothetical protein